VSCAVESSGVPKYGSIESRQTPFGTMANI
jgi:hypothetical protein